jgi:hypothetical protein
MFMAIIMLGLWQSDGAKYSGAFNTTSQAYYQGSDIKKLVDRTVDKMKKDSPTVASIAPVMYTLGMKKEIRVKTSRLTLIPNTATHYKYDAKRQIGSVEISWRF